MENLIYAFRISEEALGECLKQFRGKGEVGFEMKNHTVFYRASKDEGEKWFGKQPRIGMKLMNNLAQIIASRLKGV